MAGERRLDAVRLTVGGQPLAVPVLDRLTLVRVEESVHLPDAFVLRFDDPHFELFDEGVFTLGTPVEVALQAEGDPVRVTAGEVTALAVEQGQTGLHDLVVQGLDATHRLARVPRTRSYQQVTDADIAARVAAEHRLDADIAATEEVHDYVLQVGQTDQAFLLERARRVGFDVWISEETLHFQPTPTSESSPPVLVWGENLHRWKVRFSSSERCDEVVVRGWDSRAKRALRGRATADPGEGTGTTARAARDLAADARSAFGDVPRSAGHHPVESQAEADALARAFLVRAAGSEVLARGEATGDPLLAAGAEVTVERLGERMSGTYRLTSVEHVYGAGTPYVTRFTCGGKDPTSLPDLLGATSPRGSGVSAAGGAGWGGLVVGIVTNVDDDERLGRVKVTYPTAGGEDESAWARLVAPGAGRDRGLQCLPEVDDEVVVGFELGDPRRPVVLGGLWNREDRPPRPDAVSGGVAVRSWTSREGHHVTFHDGDDAGITIATKSGSHVRLRDASAGGISVEAPDVEVVADRRLRLRGREVAIDGSRVAISADAELTLKGAPIRLN